jgi:biotin synthase
MNMITDATIRHDWTYPQVQALFDLPFHDLLYRAQTVHRHHFDPNTVQVSTLLSIKTGKCPEDCAYCPQSNRYETGLEQEDLLAVEAVIAEARKAKEKGATRFCMGAAWRCPKERDMPKVLAMVEGVKGLGMETCMTLGMLTDQQARKLADAGLDYYNHNLDTSPEYYSKIITTRTFQDRIDTLDRVRSAGMKVCSGGIIGMGESEKDRIGLLVALANMPVHPESVPINQLVRVEGTPLEEGEAVDPFDFLRTIAVARILMPASHVRLSAGRESMSDEMQALAFHAGANSIFHGEKLLTTPNASVSRDESLFRRLGIRQEQYEEERDAGLAALEQVSRPFYNAAS